MNRIKYWLLDKLSRALKEHDSPPDILKDTWELSSASTLTVKQRTERIQSCGMDFTLHRVDGGWVLEYHSYDRKTGDSEHRINIINENDDLGDRLSQILTMELLRR